MLESITRGTARTSGDFRPSADSGYAFTLTSLNEDSISRIVRHLEREGDDALRLFNTSRALRASPSIRQSALTGALRRGGPVELVLGNIESANAAEAFWHMKNLVASAHPDERERRLCALVKWANTRGGLRAFHASIFALHYVELSRNIGERLVVIENCVRGVSVIPAEYRFRLYSLTLDGFIETLKAVSDRDHLKSQPLIALRSVRVLNTLKDQLSHLEANERGIVAAAILEATRHLPFAECLQVWTGVLRELHQLTTEAATLIMKATLKLPDTRDTGEIQNERTFFQALVEAIPITDGSLTSQILATAFSQIAKNDNALFISQIAKSFSQTFVIANGTTREIMCTALSSSVRELPAKRAMELSESIAKHFPAFPPQSRTPLFITIASFIELSSAFDVGENLARVRYNEFFDENDASTVERAISHFMQHSLGRSTQHDPRPITSSLCDSD